MQGYVDSIRNGWLAGWAWDPALGDEPITVDVLTGERVLASVVADQYRDDLVEKSIGNGSHGFVVKVPPEIVEAGGGTLRVRVHGSEFELFNSPFVYRCPRPGTELGEQHEADFKLDPENFARIVGCKGTFRFTDLRVDVVDNCNANCIYCPIPRSSRRLDVEAFRGLLDRKVVSIERLQFGCGQEPTLHSELTKFFQAAAASRAKPGSVQMVTNGMLLHRHDPLVMRDSGLKRLLVSVDSSREETQSRLRPGTRLRQITANIESFRRACPEVEVSFSIVVSKINVDEMPELVTFGKSLGVGDFVFREVHDFSVSKPRKADVPKTIREISLPPGAFARMVSHVNAAHPGLRAAFLDLSGLSVRPSIILEEGIAPVGENRIAQPSAERPNST